MNRRGFLSKLVKVTVATAAAVVVGDELWTPGRKAFFHPPAGGWKSTLKSRWAALHEQYVNGKFSETSGFDWYMDQNVHVEVGPTLETNKARVAEYWYRSRAEDAAFYAGDQWPEDVRAARAAAGRSTLTINRIHNLASQVAARVAKAPDELDVVYRRVASDPSLQDLQRLYNYQLSAAAELISLRPMAPFVSGKQITALQPAIEEPMQAAMRETHRAMNNHVRQMYPGVFD